MTARTIALLDHDDGREWARWSLAAAIVLAGHAGLIASYFLLHSPQPQGAPAAPAIIIDLAPVAVAPPSPVDVAPGPEMVESQQVPEPQVVEPPPPEVVELPPTPPVTETPLVALPEPKPPERKPEPKPVETKRPEPKPVERPRVERKPPAPQTTAPPRSERRTARVAAAPNPGSVASSAAIAAWRDQVLAKLQRAKRYPAGAEARRSQGVVMLSFSLSRGGGVLGRSVARSSGASELDQEALSMVQRAAPFPPFPTGMNQASVNLSVPIRFSVR
jgi:protein TonB